MAIVNETDINPELLAALYARAISEGKSLDEVANRVIDDGLHRLEIERLERMMVRGET